MPDDVGVRVDYLDTMEQHVAKCFPNEDMLINDQGDDASSILLPVDTAASQDAVQAPCIAGASQPCLAGTMNRKSKYPRVDAPEVEDGSGEAIREDTPGYIVMAFPKLFPHGTGDFHSSRGPLRHIFQFEEWGRFVMSWHDGRFMRHTRFRYWLLDTSLRLMTPRMQRTFFRTHEAATAYTLDDLSNKEIRKKLLQQMSTATSDLPGSVGERRKMR